jgi:hypothetical protein
MYSFNHSIAAPFKNGQCNTVSALGYVMLVKRKRPVKKKKIGKHTCELKNRLENLTKSK